MEGEPRVTLVVVPLVGKCARTAMLCSVVHIAVPVCLGIIVIDILVPLPNPLGVEAALPPGAEDEIILIEHLPGRRVHLQDFFWTSAEDAPPWLDPDQTLSIYETRTVHHTVTIYGPEDSTSLGPSQDPRISPELPVCISCIEPTPTVSEDDRDIGVLVGEDPGPRYWLLTVIRSGESVPPKVELRLARLYRTAFSRQQQRHLGLLQTDPRSRRAANKRRAYAENRASVPEQKNFDTTRTGERNNTRLPGAEEITVTKVVDNERNIKNTMPKRMRQVKIPKARTFLRIIDKGLLSNSSERETQPPHSVGSIEIGSSEKVLAREEFNDKTIIPESLEYARKEQTLQSSFFISNLIGPRGRRYASSNFTEVKSSVSSSSNTTVESPFEAIKEPTRDPRALKASMMISEDSEKIVESSGNKSESFNSSRSKLRSVNVGLVQVRMQNTTVTESGGTKLIYSVHLGGKPVPAETAAKDMALLSPQEVALELGVPVIIQSEPYLKETRPLALSRKRDAWLLVGAGGAAIALFGLIIVALIIAAKRKRAHSAVSAPPTDSILKKDRVYTPTTPGLDNTGYTSETEGRTQTDGTSQRQTPGSRSRSPITPLTPQSLNDDDIQEFSSDNDEEVKRQQSGKSWDIEEYPETIKNSRGTGRRRVTRTDALNQPRTPDSMDTVISREDNLEYPEEARIRKLEETASPHSYLSMPSCKIFPNMRSVEPLSKILEPVVVGHLDLEFETPEIKRRGNGSYDPVDRTDEGLNRTRSALKDPGVVGPIVWDLRRQRAVEETGTSETDGGERPIASGPVGRARRRLHELLEDSFSLFGTRDVRAKEPPVYSSSRPTSAARSPPDRLTTGTTMFSESRGKSAHVSPVATPITQPKTRPRTSLPRGGIEEEIPETGNAAPHSRGAWGSRPLSAGPFHRPNLPEIDVNRVLSDHQLSSEDPAIPLIAAIRKELDRFTPNVRS